MARAASAALGVGEIRSQAGMKGATGMMGRHPRNCTPPDAFRRRLKAQHGRAGCALVRPQARHQGTGQRSPQLIKPRRSAENQAKARLMRRVKVVPVKAAVRAALISADGSVAAVRVVKFITAIPRLAPKALPQARSTSSFRGRATAAPHLLASFRGQATAASSRNALSHCHLAVPSLLISGEVGLPAQSRSGCSPRRCFQSFRPDRSRHVGAAAPSAAARVAT